MKEIFFGVDIERLILSYMHIYIERFKKEGYDFDEAEIRSDISFAVANSISYYPKKKNIQNRRTAKFSTYAIVSIKNAMRSYKKRLRREAEKLPIVEYCAPDFAEEPVQECSVIIRELFRRLSRTDRAVAYQLLCPTETVLKLISIYERRQHTIKPLTRNYRYSSIIFVIARLFRMSDKQILRSRERIRQTLSELL